MNPLLIFPIIIGYACYMILFRITTFKPKPYWKSSLLDIFKIALPVAIFEEFIFRYAVMDKLLGNYLSIELAILVSALFFSLTHFVWGMYKNGAEYGTPDEISMLTIGLTLFGIVCGIYYTQFGILYSIAFHASSIYAVQLLGAFTTNESKKYLWLYDNGHQLLRSPLIWLILLHLITVI